MLRLSIAITAAIILTACGPTTEPVSPPIPKAQITSLTSKGCYEGPIKVTTLHEINAAEVRTGVNLFDSPNEKARIERKAYLATLRFWTERVEDAQTRACYSFWLDRAEEGNLTPASIESIPVAH